MSTFKIPLHKPFWGREEEKAAILAMRSGTGVGDLSFSENLSEELKQSLNVAYALPTGSGTAALELACDSLLKKDDEVIVPSFTFSSCANAIILAGAKPIFCDIDINTYNIDPAALEKLINKKTKAIMVVHYAGFACDMDKILNIARKNKLYVIEDAAHALGASYKDKKLGTIGDVGCFSFHGTKNVASGEGGAFVTNEKKISHIAEIIREKGTNRSAFMRGERKKYTWVHVGKSLILSDILSAIALEQIKKLDTITMMRRKSASYMLSRLEKINSKLILPHEPDNVYGNWHIFAIRVPRLVRDHLIKRLRAYGIEASFHYLPLHSSKMGAKLGYKVGDLPVTEEVSATLVRLPMYPGLKKSEIDYIAAVIKKILL
ncbi:dTDP-4-amino-4,6-dideoxygalactose transaminase [Candidatus Curtissbacteria bacterium]|nr:dTDP-4-amino-4,6-dideoxygalactose transaminase [Candidatus Curtissbacteria bacterium]